MIKRIIDISEQSYLSLEKQQMLIRKEDKIIARIPVEDIGILVLQHPAIVVTQALVIACQKNNTVIVFCDERHLPYSLVLPLTEANSLHQKILQQQISTSKAMQNRLWKQIVMEKISNQANVLKKFDREHQHLMRLANRVKSADRENHEAQAAQKYWRLLFGKDFRRDTNAGGINALLNYGYAILRAMIARAIVAGGLHPALGIKHHNQYNGLCLADDLMEPLRPWVDQTVMQLLLEDAGTEIDQPAKQKLLSLLSTQVRHGKKKMPLMVACHYLIADFKRALAGEIKTLKYPQAIAPEQA